MSRNFKVAVIANAHLPYDRLIVRGIAAYMRTCSRWSLYVEEDPLQKLPDLRTWKGDGLIVDFDDQRVAQATRLLDLPIVGIGGGGGWYDPATRIPYFETDDVKIAELAAEHLLDLGLRRFAYYGAPVGRVSIWSQTRAAAFAGRIAESGYACDVLTSRYKNAHNWDKLLTELMTWLKGLEPPVGLMACNDVRARYVLEACRALELRIPDDVAVIGVDNDELMCELSQPPLTSIEQGAFHLGYEAAALLDRMLRGHKPRQLRYRVKPVGLVARQSTDIVAIDDAEVAAALKLIRATPCPELQAERVAEQVSLSRCTLDRRFKLAVGMTVHEKIQLARLARAKELLSATDWPLSAVAREAGYANVQYLSAVMRQSVGQTPTQYRLFAQKIK